MGAAAKTVFYTIIAIREKADMKDISQEALDNSLRDIQKELEQLSGTNATLQGNIQELSERVNYTVQSAQ